MNRHDAMTVAKKDGRAIRPVSARRENIAYIYCLEPKEGWVTLAKGEFGWGGGEVQPRLMDFDIGSWEVVLLEEE